MIFKIQVNFWGTENNMVEGSTINRMQIVSVCWVNRPQSNCLYGNRFRSRSLDII